VITIEKLNPNNINDLDAVSEIMYNWWANSASFSFTTVKELIKSYCSYGDFPMVLIAKDLNKVVGTISLVANDTQFRQDLYPVITSLYVIEEYRNNGIGSMLIKELLNYAKDKFNKVYLLTHSIGFYEKLGFKYVETSKAYIDVLNDKITENRLYEIELR
jgi:predicted N-acetyltransferase YhbS